MTNSSNQPSARRDEILDLVLSGHAPSDLASQFGVTEWTIRRWVAHAQRRKHLPYWQQMARAPSGSEGRNDRK